jgi:hypothetical protein
MTIDILKNLEKHKHHHQTTDWLHGLLKNTSITINSGSFSSWKEGISVEISL